MFDVMNIMVTNEAEIKVKRSTMGNTEMPKSKFGHYVHDGMQWIEQGMEGHPRVDGL